LARSTTLLWRPSRSDGSLAAKIAAALCATAMCLLAARTTAFAAGAGAPDGIVISPVRVTLPADHRTGFFVITNSTRDSVLFQVEVNAWTQSAGFDRLSPTGDVLAVPVVFAIAPGASQTVRLALRREPDAAKELTYRIFASELTSGAPRADTTNVLLRFSLPIFALPLRADGPSLRWSCVREKNGRLRVTAANVGDEHTLVATAGLFSDAQHHRAVATWTPAAYLLAGQSRTWTIRAAVAASVTQLFVETRSIEGMQTDVAPVTSP